ncbi:hypothetical protein [Fulvimonas soli]|uniref:Uncharacterized protein n=1 Tax=Fulvimonas soli TaxID=155197 RepID=A0A316IID4_9GAMM|nr:hypothetical protein [Fulvimonas soli]PWK92843.1 hypothetical protein C7456_101179 [Fulvimonas soli]TNY26476.1 hypothetical protein BV497_08565 [Fulvimonas soli]
MSTNNESEARVPGIYELARNHLTQHRNGFASGDAVWVVSAWTRLLDGLPEDINYDGEGAGSLFETIIEDVGDEAAFSALDEEDESNDRAQTCIELAKAYGLDDWPRLALRDYLIAFDGMSKERAEAASRRAWNNARAAYDCFKLADGQPEKKAA